MSTILYRFGIMAGGYAILEYVNIVEMIRSKTAKKKGGKAHGREDQKPKTEDRRPKTRLSVVFYYVASIFKKNGVRER